MKMFKLVSLLCLVVIGTPSALAQNADLVVRNAVIWTVDEENPTAEALASLGGRLIYVGSDSGVEEHIGPDTRVIDLRGRFVTPGYYDNHVHFEGTGQLLYGLNLLDVSDEAAFVERIRDVDSRYAPGTWIQGGDWSAYETWAAGDVAEAGREVNPDDMYGNLFLPNKDMIDGFTEDRPVLVRRFDRKVYMANSAALERAGIQKGTPDPAGIAVERTSDGEPTGALFNPVSGAGVIELVVIRRLYQRDHLDQVLATFALILILSEATRWAFGSFPLYLNIPPALSGSVRLPGGIEYSLYRLSLIGIGLLIALALFWLISKTRIGMRIRAGENDREMIAALGVDISKLYTVIFALGAALAGLSGALVGAIQSVQVGMGEPVLILAFVVIVIGGIGSIKGALIGAVLVGLTDTLGRVLLPPFFATFMEKSAATTVGSSLSSMLIYILMAAVLIFRPSGLYGRA